MPLPKRYLWAIGLDVARVAGELVGDRYRYQGTQILLDLKPGVLPNAPSELPQEALPYLRLANYRLHLPQIYGWVELPDEDAILLLSDAAVYRPSIYTVEQAPDGQSAAGPGSLTMPTQSCSPIPLPKLSDEWGRASSWRRLNWLWQIAQLWQPLEQERVVSSLLSPHLLRVEGDLIRLLELHSDGLAGDAGASLSQLGPLLQAWLGPDDRDSSFFKSLCHHLIDGKIQQPAQLLEIIEGAIARLSPSRARSIDLVTQTDQGPSRSRNEDACFPPSGTLLSYPSKTAPDGEEAADQPVMIVCDGIGGHQGGDVASQLAIHSVCDHLIEHRSTGNPLEIFQQMTEAIYDANDLISQRNDGEQRRHRQRMGTTLVMALVSGHECYISHVGDSRAYWITRWGCHQITLDDDVASRELRLGYATYPNALDRPSAGSLVQALGMADSASLRPTVQRLLLGDSGLLLLCSDGLSDNDLVDSFWQSTLLPVLAGEQDIAAASQELVTIANTQNGYDNVTVGLMLWRATSSASLGKKALTIDISSLQTAEASTRLQLRQAPLTTVSRMGRNREPLDTIDNGPEAAADIRSESVSTAVTPIPLKTDLRRPTRLVPLLAGIVILLGLGGLLIYVLVPSAGSRFSRLNPAAEVARPPSSPAPNSGAASTNGVRDRIPLTVGTTFRIGNPATPSSALSVYTAPRGTATPNQPDDEADAASPRVAGTMVSGTLVQIVGRSEFSQSTRWIELQVCSLPEPDPNAASRSETTASEEDRPEGAALDGGDSGVLLQPGETGWLEETAVVAFGIASSAETSSVCTTATN